MQVVRNLYQKILNQNYKDIKMKKFLIVLVALSFVVPAFAAKKVVKKHQKFTGTKISDDKLTKPAAPKKKK